MTQFGRTAGAAATYVLLAGLQRGVSLLILPLITHSISPEDYGAASVLATTSLLLTSIIATPLTQVIIRAAARPEKDGHAWLRVAGIYCYYIVPLVISLLAVSFALLVPELLGVSGLLWGIELVAIGFQPAASTFALWVTQAREDLGRFVWLSSTSVLATAGSKLILVVGLHLGVLGWVLSDLLSALVSAALACVLVRVPRVKLEFPHIRYVVNFTLPLIPHSASLWILTSISRPLMAMVSPLEQVGFFSFALNLASVATLILAESNRAVLPRYAREALNAPTSETLNPVKWQFIAAFIVPTCIGGVIALVGNIIFAKSYWPAFSITGILLIGQVAYGLYLIPMNYLTQTAGLPRYSAFASGAGAVIITGSVLAWGRSEGAVGVAYATAAAYLAMTGVAFLLTVIHKLDISWRAWLPNLREFSLASIAFALSVGALLSPIGSPGRVALAAICLSTGLGSIILTVRRSHR